MSTDSIAGVWRKLTTEENKRFAEAYENTFGKMGRPLMAEDQQKQSIHIKLKNGQTVCCAVAVKTFLLIREVSNSREDSSLQFLSQIYLQNRQDISLM